MCSAVCAFSPQGHWSVSPTLNVLYKCSFSLLWFALSLKMTTCSCLSSWLYASALLYFGCSNFHFRFRHDLMIVFSPEYVVVVESICSRCAPCLARVSASLLPLRPQWAGIHCRVVLYLLDRSVSFVNRLCCSLSLLLLIDWRTERASVRIQHYFWSFQGLLLPLPVPCSLYYAVLLVYWHGLHHLHCAVCIPLLLALTHVIACRVLRVYLYSGWEWNWLLDKTI